MYAEAVTEKEYGNIKIKKTGKCHWDSTQTINKVLNSFILIQETTFFFFEKELGSK